MAEVEQEEKIKTQLQETRQRIAVLEAAAAAARGSASSRKADMQEELQRVREKVACLDRVGGAMDALGNKLAEAQGYAFGRRLHVVLLFCFCAGSMSCRP